MLWPLLPALLAAFAPSLPCRCQGWSPPAAGPPAQPPPPPLNSSTAVPPGRPGSAARAQAGGARAPSGMPSAAATTVPSRGPPRLAPQRPEAACNLSVQRQMLSSLLVRWSPLDFQCDLVLFSTSGPGGRAFFSAAFHRVGPPPLLIEHVGLAAGGVQQDLRLCVGCSPPRGRRVGRLRPGGSGAAAAFFAASSSSSSVADAGPPWQQGEWLQFCCLDFSLEELKGDPGWRLNRKPIESTLVACFMTLVIIVWSVAALIWPVPIIAGFLPNGMEQRRSAAAAATSGSASGTAAGPK
ncbi:transmembrane protein 158 [Paroedura picta]|uniref:transmembrane protein 158 n=1 Tax=Paroedura picta TaxID=143630 RepID=UPI0040569E2E